MFNGRKCDNQRGFSLSEIIVVITVVSLSLLGFLNLSTFSLNVYSKMQQKSAATILAHESIEAVRTFRDNTDWSMNGLGSLVTGSDYYPELITTATTSYWSMTGGVETIGEYTRRVVFDSVERNGSDNIVASGGTVDPDTVKVTSAVNWRSEEIELITYLTNWDQ